MTKKIFGEKFYLFLANITLLTLVAGCSQGRVDPFDRQTGVTREEIKNAMYGDRTKKNAKKDEPKNSSVPAIPQTSIPRPSRIIAIPSLPKEKADKLISFAVTEQVPLKDVLIELAKAAKLDVDLDPTIDGGVIVNAKNRPLSEVLNRVCEMGNLRYTLKNGRLHVEKDLPFAKNYLTDYLIDGALWADVERNIVALITGEGGAAASGSVSSNKLANIMTVFASQKNHVKVAEYLESVKKHASAQVLIEAKVVEVTLSDDYRTGIDWSWVRNGREITQTAGGPVSGGTTDTTDPLTVIIPSQSSIFGGNISASITALEEFGTVKAISSPRINTMNNQKATLNFTQKLVYFTNDTSSNSTTSTAGTNVQNTVTSTKNEEPTGTELTITPSIDLENNEITLYVNPKITVQSGEVTQTVLVPDTNSETGEFTELTNQIPIINTRELTTVAKIKSGSVLVIGGVMNENTTNTDSGIPFLNRIPVLGYLFKSTVKNSEVNETVVFVKATIIGTSDGVGKYDRDLNDTFSSRSRSIFTPE